MKLLFCAEFFHPSVGGVQEVMRHLAIRMAAAGHEVTVATSFLAERASNEYNGIRIKPFRISGNIVRGMIGEVEAYRQFLIQSDFDVLFVYAAQQWTFDALWDVLTDLRMQKVLVPCGYPSLADPHYQEYYDKLPHILAQFDALVYHARNYRDYEFGRRQGFEDRAVVIPNGADDQEFSVAPDPDFRRRMGIPPDAVMLLTVGSLNGEKGHLELVQAFEQLDLDQPAVLVLNGNQMPGQRKDASIAGRIRKGIGFVRAAGLIQTAKEIIKAVFFAFGIRIGIRRVGCFKELKNCVRRVNRIRDRKVLICDLGRRDLIQAYFSADLFVFASHTEYSPLVLYEACAAGTPFLSVSVGNAAEIADWTGGGEITAVAPDGEGLIQVSPSVLAAAIKRLLADKPRRTQLGAAGRRAWKERFNWNVLAHEYMQLFERVCAEREKRV